MKRCIRLSVASASAVVIMAMLLAQGIASAQFLLSPQSGDVYKEFSLVNSSGNSWRVTDPNSTFNSNPPGNNPADFLPNPTMSINGVDLFGAVRAELVVDLWGGHIGTTPKQVHFKNAGADTSYITIPEITSVPDPTHGQCYMQQANTTVAVPLNQLVSGTNLIQANAGPQDGACGQNFGWGQWGWNGAVLRVYYNPATKAHATGTITSPTNGGSFGENPLVTATASGGAGVASVDFVGYYTSYDIDGDGRFTDWQHNYHRRGFESTMGIHDHIGTATSSPYQVTWNTDWVPDQTVASIKFHARIRDNNGVYYVTPEVSNLTLTRNGSSVKMYTVSNLPGGYWIRNGGTVGTSVNITDNLADATAARMFITTWNGQDCDGGAHDTQINNSYTFPSYGGCNYWSYDVFDFPTSALLPNQNQITVYSASAHHGIEVMVPGPAVMVRYNSVAAPTITQHPTNQTVQLGATANFSVTADGSPTPTYQWQKNNINISGATSASYTTPATVAGDNGATFRCVVSNSQGTVTSNSAILSVNSLTTVGGPWWNSQWHYRTQIAVAGGGFQRTSKVANFTLNFTSILSNLGAGGSFNPLSVRVIEVDVSGNVIDQNVVFQFDQDPSFNASTDALGTVAFLMSGTTASNATRYYHIYFDTGSGFSLPSFSNQVTLTDNVFFAGQSSYKIDNQLGSLWYHKVGGGFAAMRDLNNVEWIGFDPTSGSHAAGEYRGIPNMGPYAHPGYTNGSSTILSQGPIKVTIKTVTTDGSNASWIWEFYPTYQTMTLQQTGVNYWLLYEGIPNGTLDQVNGYWKNSTGANGNLGTQFTGDLPNTEWVYFGQTGQQRFLYLAHHEDDALVDHYRPFFDVGAMTVFGFGRDNSSVNHYLSQAPAHLTFGFGEQETQSAQTIDNAFRDLTTSTGASEENVTGPASITSQPTNQNVVVGQTATFIVGATGSSPLGYQWQKNNVNIGGATNSSYTTPATVLGDSGSTFRCIVSNTLGTVTSNSAILGVSTAPISFTSDDFSAGSINTGLWTVVNPGTPSTIDLTGTGTSDALLRLQLPASSHDVWTGGNFAPRLMQNCGNVDFTAEVKFQSSLTSAYQMQGIIVEQDANNYLRFDFLQTPSGLFTYSASFTGGNPTQRINTGIASSNPLWLRVNRTGNVWTMSYSTNGTTFTTAGSFTHTLAVTKIGPFAGNAGSPTPATTVLVDYFFNTLSPVAPEDATIPVITSQPRDTSVVAGQTASFSVAATGAAGYQWQKNTIDIGGATSATYITPATVIGDSGATFRCIVSNAGGTVTSNSAILSVTTPPPPSTIVSDDFHTGTLNASLWTFVDPLADDTLSLIGANTTDALLRIAVPSGTTHDIFTTGYNAPRIMQDANNTNFDVVAKFQSVFNAQFQHQGIVVEQDANNVIRFDIYFDGANTNVFAASMIGGFGAPTSHLNTGIGAGPQNPAYLKINRTGNVWTVSYSFDGTAYTSAGSFSLPFTVAKVGVWGGNSGGTPPAFTMLCDYFFNSASPVVPEDPIPPSAPNITSQPTNQTVNDGQTATFTVVAIGNPTPTYRWQKNTVDIGGATSASYITPATTPADSGAAFRCIVSNTLGTVTSNSAILNVNRVGPTITQQPRDTTVLAGQTASFSVSATGSSTLSYQWQKNNVNIAGATSASYITPATVAGDNNALFRCIVSNAIGTDTSASATLTVSTQPAGTIVSDDFSAGVLNGSLWTFINPGTPSTMSFTGVGTTDALLSIAVPAGGTGHDVWTGGNFAPRIMQNINDGDFQAEVKFQSQLGAAYQMQGMIVEQDANNYLRFDFLATPAGISVFAASFTGGNPTQRVNVAITNGNPLWLRVTRTGNSWTVAYSSNGTTFTTAGTFTHTLTVSKVGPFAGNAPGASSPALTCLIDYFFNTAFPVNPEDPTIPVITSQPRDTSVVAGQTASFSVVATGAAGYQWQKNNVNIGGATSATYITPATVIGDSGATFRCIVSNAGGTVTSNSAILSVTTPPPPSTIVSDDFHTGTLNASLWTYVDPLADDTLSLIGANTTDALLRIAVPSGTTHDIFTTGYNAPRIMQDANNTNFDVVAKFQSVFNAQFQHQGIVVEQDANNVIRFDIYFDGANTNVFAASMIGGFGAPTSHLNTGIGAGPQNPAYLKINRTGNVWTVSYSFDGTAYTSAGSFSLPFTVAKVGVWGGNSGGTPPAFTMLCDYFFNSASPVVPEDPIPPSAPNITSQPTNQTVNDGQTATFTVVAIGNPTPTYQWQKNTVNIGGATSASYITPATTPADSGAAFRCIVSNTLGTVTSNSAILNVNRVPATITVDPTNQSVQVGQTATFSVTAVGTAPLAYQWQKNNVNIGGATSASYITPATVAGDNNALFRCIVSNAIGTDTSASATLTVSTQPAGTIVSDDFSAGVLNTSLWTFTNPGTASTLNFTGVGTVNALLSIAVPAGGTGHDVWTGGNFAPRIMQNINDGDFQAEVKFQSQLGAAYQMQGMIVEQDANNYLRFDFLATPAGISVFAASFTGGNPTQRVNVAITNGNPLWLRVTRTGNSWTVAYSSNGTTFTTAGTFTHTLTVSKVGPFAGNAPGASSPALTCLIDYFFNTAFPITPEDPTAPPSAPTITLQPSSQTVGEGQTAAFSVTATGNPSPAFQWQKNNVDIAGATSANYTTPATVLADSGATFRCVVSNSQGTVTSNSAILNVNRVGPAITQQPSNQTVTAGQTANFSVTATGSPTLLYQWQKNNVNIGGATSANYTTPATVAGDDGSTFRCIVSNSIGTVTSNPATLTVSTQPAGTIISDDFHTGTLNGSLWTFTNPNSPSTLSFTGVGTSDALLSIAVPAGGSGHDVWTGGNFAPRIMQNISNGDFQAEVKFQSTLTSAYQMQGMIVEQDANNYLRFDFLRTPSGLFAFSASFTAGNPTQRINTGVTGANPMWLRVNRTGNAWTMSYSTDGTTFTTAGTFTFALTVAKVGPFAGNASGASSPALTCLVDYFFNTAFPINPEDATLPTITQQPADQTVSVGNAATFTVAASGASLAYQWQKNNVDIGGATIANYTTPATVQGDSGATFRCVVSNSQGTVTSNSAILHVVPPPPPSTIVSDDFHATPLNAGLWTFVNPQADATQSITGAGTTDALLNIVVPSGTRHDIYDQGYLAPRIMQNANNVDFTVEAKFQSVFTGQFQHEGVVVEQDTNNVIRFDIYFDGTNTSIFAASMIGGFGAPANHINVSIGSGAQNPAYMRVNRTGNLWTLSYSLNGTTFTEAGQFTLPFTVAKVGVWGGNSGASPAFTLLCDYFFNTASPINPEDPAGPPSAPVVTLQPTNQTVNEGQTASFSVTATGNPAPTYQWQKNNVNIGGATNASYITPATVFADSGATFRCVVSNSQGTVTSNSAILNVNRVAPTITGQPANQTVQVGQTANFSVTATGSPTLVYQWQKNNVNIGGANSADYTTPATVAGDNGATFRCIVSNAVGTVTSNPATLTVDTQPAGTIVSDDFHTGTLNASLWTFTNPNSPSTLSFTGVGTTDALLSIAVPAGGSGHDVWTGGNFAPRIMQNISNGDFQAEVKFQSAPSSAYQMEGIIVEQDANNYLRFDLLHIGSGLRAYAASFVSGTPTQRINVAATSGSMLWLRVTRTGNSWTLAVSTNGTTFTTAGTFTHTLTVSKVGPFAGNASGATSPAFTALIDYFFNTAFPESPEDPVAPVITTQPVDQSVALGNTATFTVEASGASLAYQWQKNAVTIGGANSASYTTPATVQADSGATFRCIVSNAFGTVTSNGAMLHILPPAAPSTIVSDDFSAAILNGSLWTYVNPLADATQTLTGTGTSDALLSIAIPGGTAHDLFTNGYEVPRIMQNANNTDFTVEAKFQSAFTAQFQSEGIVVEQDASNVIRFDIYFDGVNTSIFAASFIGGFASPTMHINSGITGGAQNPAYLRINRAGNNWTVSYSFDGTAFTQAGTFTLPFTVTKVGVWGGNSGTNPAFTLLCDYFFNTATPVNPEDPTGPPVAPSITQQPVNQTVNEGQTAAFIVSATGNPTPSYQWQKNNVNIGGATNASYTTPATVFADSGATFRCIVSNSQGTVTSNSAVLTVNRVAPTITQQPSNQTVTVGQTANFSVTATGSPTISYQWQKNTVNIGGATSADYTTPATVQGDSGATFRCIVSNSIGTVTSNSAILNVSSAAPGQPVSDDFSSGTLNASVWTFTNPGTPSTLSFTGTGTADARLSIAIPAGNAHDVYSNGIEAPRIMQTIGNVDFTVEAKFESTLDSRYQFQGMIIQQDLNNFIRTDLYHDGGGIHVFAATFVAGAPTVQFDGVVPTTNPLWLRVNRSGNTWTIGYSTDGTTFVNASPFSFTITTSAIGVFAGNQGNTSTTAPAFTMLCDYFFNISSPINPEDPTGPQSGPSITQHPGNATVDEGGRATFSVVASGSPLNYQWQKNGLNIGGATNASYITPANLIAESGANFRCIVSNGLGTTTSNQALLTVNSLTGPGINVWYGTTQSFGTLGDPIPFVNILGHASDVDGIQHVRYTLNGGSPVTLQIAADGRRIDEDGNFNIEIPRTSLTTGSNAIVITLTDNLNNVTTKNVTLNYSGGGNAWPQSYSINWNAVSNVHSVAQPSDGLWAPDTNGVRMIKPRYDRLLTIGEQSWTNYEVTFPFTVYSLTADAFGYPSNNPGIGAILRWNGSTDNPLSGANPKTGYLPLGSIGWFTWTNPTTGNMQLLDNNANPAANDVSGFNITFGTRYMFKMKVYSAGISQAPTYRMKMWPASQAEPGSWSISFTGSPTDPSSGSLVLLAHECDVNFGNVTVVPTVSAARPVRSPDDIVAMYRFDEGTGRTIHDRAEKGKAADLTIETPHAASWVNGGGVALNMPSGISSADAGTKIIDALKASNAMTVEAWLKPTLVTSSSPLHFFSLLDNNGVRLFDVQSAMNGDRSAMTVEAQVQTSAVAITQPFGSSAASNGLTHVAFTRDASGAATLYINGEKHTNGTTSVNFTDWNHATLVLGGEEDGWLGEYKLVAVYSRALTAAQVRTHFEGGPDAEFVAPVVSSMAPVTNSTPTITQEVPKEFALYQNYPNPFNPSTTIKFDMPKDENVTLTLFNLLGQQVATLVNERKPAGSYSIQWNARGFATGVYIYRIKAGDFVQTRKLVLIK